MSKKYPLTMTVNDESVETFSDNTQNIAGSAA